MVYESEVDVEIIKKIAEYPENRYDDIRRWFNCNMCMADDKQFDSAEWPTCLKLKNETFFKFILIYYFEKRGFNALVKSNKCHECESKKHGEKVKKHAVAMLKAFNEVAAITANTHKNADNWHKKFGDVYEEMFKEEYNKKLNEKCFESLSQLYKKVNVLRENIESSRIETSYTLLSEEIKGVGDKIAKFIVRDLLFLLTDWGFQVKMKSARDNLEYAIPVDIWVRRVTLSIPTLKKKTFELMKTDEELDKFISKAIAQVCSELEVNPLRFDFGAYLIGENKIKKEWKKFDKERRFEEVYEQLKRFFLNENNQIRRMSAIRN